MDNAITRSTDDLGPSEARDEPAEHRMRPMAPLPIGPLHTDDDWIDRWGFVFLLITVGFFIWLLMPVWMN
jgi:hypothetical protein